MRVMLVMTLLGCVYGAQLSCGQGSLTPPGPPGPTMKTLDQLALMEPRTPITSAPYTITAPGSYYLVKNLTTTGHGLVIQSSDVTVDLMGFSICGDCETGEYGVLVRGISNAPLAQIVVKNGAIRGFDVGIRWENGQNGCIEHVMITSNLNSGIDLFGREETCSGNKIVNCAIRDSSSLYGRGIRLSSSSEGHCDDNVIENCVVVSGNNAIDFADCLSDAPHIENNMVINCNLRSTDYGFGVTLQSYSDGVFRGNTISRCLIAGGVHFIGGMGVTFRGNVLAGCTINGWVNIEGSYGGVSEGNMFRDCVIQGAGLKLWGSSGNRIEGNHISSGTSNGTYSYGIYTADYCSNNIIVCNTCVGFATNYAIADGNVYGPIVTNVGALPSTGDAAHPWANFSR